MNVVVVVFVAFTFCCPRCCPIHHVMLRTLIKYYYYYYYYFGGGYRAFRRSLKVLASACRTWFDTARRLVDMDWYRYNTGRDTRPINGCGPTPESVRGSKGRNAQRRGFLSEDSCRSSERVSATIIAT